MGDLDSIVASRCSQLETTRGRGKLVRTGAAILSDIGDRATRARIGKIIDLFYDSHCHVHE